jgi:hypothetical protein
MNKAKRKRKAQNSTMHSTSSNVYQGPITEVNPSAYNFLTNVSLKSLDNAFICNRRE